MKEVRVPRESINDDTVVIVEIHVKDGVYTNSGSIVVTLETSKTCIDITAECDGFIFHNLVKGVELNVGDVLFRISKDKKFIIPEEMSKDLSQEFEKIPGVKYSKKAVLISEKLGVPLSNFSTGWVDRRAIEEFVGIVRPHDLSIGRRATADSIPAAESTPTAELFQFPHEKVKFSKRKLSEINALSKSERNAISSTIGMRIKVISPRIVAPPFLFKSTISDLVVYEASRLMSSYQELNASVLDAKNWAKISKVNFGWSFDSGRNLKVLTINDSNLLSLKMLQQAVLSHLYLYESGKPIPNEFLDSPTVTISDLSSADASFMLPLINGNQTLILGLVSLDRGHFEIFATFDHRVAEGYLVSKFLTELKERIISHFHKSESLKCFCTFCEKSMDDEIKLGARGMTKLLLPNGEEGLICRACFEGY